MKVIKKDGRLQELDQNKIELSILNSTEEEMPLLNESDAKIIAEDVHPEAYGYSDTARLLMWL